MKKIFFALCAAMTVFAACTEDPFVTPSENSGVIEYKHNTTKEITVSSNGAWTLAPAAEYDWVTPSVTEGVNGDKVTFTFALNVTGAVRNAEFNFVNGASTSTVKFMQKSGSLDGVTVAVEAEVAAKAALNVKVTANDLSDFASYGVYYGNSDKIAEATAIELGTTVGEANTGEIEISAEKDNYVWGYVKTHTGEEVVGAATLLVAPICVEAGADLQKVINDAREGSEIRLAGGATFTGNFYIMKNNLKITGRWNADFTAQTGDWTVLDGGYPYPKKHETDRGYVLLIPKVAETPDEGNGLVNGQKYVGNYINGLKIQNGSARDAAGINIQGDLDIEACWIHNNVSYHRGGGIGCTENANRDGAEKVIVNVWNCTFSNNATKEHGGGFSNEEGMVTTMINNLFVYQWGLQPGDGWASTLVNYYDLTAVNNTYTNNVNDNGGGNYNGMQIRMVDDGVPGTEREGKDKIQFTFVNNIVAGNYGRSNGMQPDNWDTSKIVRQTGTFGHNNKWREENLVANNYFEGEVTGDHAGQYASSTIQPDLEKSVKEAFTAWVGEGWNQCQNPASVTLDGLVAAYGPGSAVVNLGYSDNGGKIDALLLKYNKDYAGNARVNGKVDLGCIELQ